MVNFSKGDVFSLHRYFIWADRMKVHFDNVLLKIQNEDDAEKYQIESFLYMSYWYGGMYVLIEGWKKLGLTDRRVDELLKSRNVDLLKRYRNGVFHYQRKYFDERFTGLIQEGENVVEWVRNLRNEFSRFFLDWLKSNNQISTLGQ